ncbi:hypothetical protein BGZ76_009320 [Entomortierella beljakovae]|nr:hypothetical protein BGZ76_009320 [Entomortierella beljakovae]
MDAVSTSALAVASAAAASAAVASASPIRCTPSHLHRPDLDEVLPLACTHLYANQHPPKDWLPEVFFGKMAGSVSNYCQMIRTLSNWKGLSNDVRLYAKQLNDYFITELGQLLLEVLFMSAVLSSKQMVHQQSGAALIFSESSSALNRKRLRSEDDADEQTSSGNIRHVQKSKPESSLPSFLQTPPQKESLSFSNEDEDEDGLAGLSEVDTKAPGNPFVEVSFDDNSSNSFVAETQEDSTGEFSVILDRPQRIVRLVGPGQQSSSLKLDRWVAHQKDVSRDLMKSRALMVECHETLQTVHEILQLNFIFTREAMLDITGQEKLSPATCCEPIRSSAMTRAMSCLSFTAANEGYLVTMKAWKRIQLEQEDSEHEEQWEVLQVMVDHLLITATLWSPLSYISRRKGNEDSFTSNIVRPFLTCAFGSLPNVKLRGNGDRFTCGNELDKELKFPDFSVTMDCYRKALGEHYLVIAEVKPPTASQKELDDDYIKLPNLMKAALDQQIAQGYGDGTVVGILIQGWRVLVFYMVLEHEAIYELRNVGQFQMVASHTQLAQLLSICPVLEAAKVMVEKTRNMLRQRPQTSQALNNEFRRPSYNITPILIPPDDLDKQEQDPKVKATTYRRHRTKMNTVATITEEGINQKNT